MFSGPRNISTTMMRSFENRPDTVVFDEPFYAWYLKESGAPHPMREETLAGQPSDWDAVSAWLNTTPPNGETIAFEKHIAFHFADAPPLNFLESARVMMLIRDPAAMVASYKNKYDDVAPIIDSFKVQRRIYEALASRGKTCPVVDARDVLIAPDAMMRALCVALDIPFSEKMLSWPAGSRISDGAWGPHWYDAVCASTGFKPYQEKAVVLPAELQEIADACQSDYAFFFEKRLSV